MTSKLLLRLIEARSEINNLIVNVATGLYDPMESELAYPISELTRKLKKAGLTKLAKAVERGKFDS